MEGGDRSKKIGDCDKERLRQKARGEERMTDCFFCFLGRTFEDVAGKEGGREDVMYQTSPSYLFAPPHLCYLFSPLSLLTWSLLLLLLTS